MSELSQEERDRIYQEEKVRKEAQDQLQKDAAAAKAKKNGMGCLGFIVILAILIYAVGLSVKNSGPGTTTSNPVNAPAPALPAAAKLLIVSQKGYSSEYGYNYVEGQVKNTSSESLQHVTAVATWYGADGKFITSDNALVEYDPLLPGQTSPFKVGSRTNPAMKKYSLAFKKLLGGEIPSEEPVQRGKKK